MNRRVVAVLVSLGPCALACGDGGGDSSTTLITLGITQGETGITTPGDGDGDGDPTGDGDGSSGDGDGAPGDGDGDGGPKLDLGMLPDVGGGPVLPTIPETCAQALMIESTVGCEFRANKMQNFVEEPSSLIVGNVSAVNVATVSLYLMNRRNEMLVDGPVQVMPSGTYE